jgi:hypothetical protein
MVRAAKRRSAVFAVGLLALLTSEPVEAGSVAYAEALEHCAILANDAARPSSCPAPRCDAAKVARAALRVVEEAGAEAARFPGEERLAPESCRIARDVVAVDRLDLDEYGKRALTLAHGYVKAATFPGLSHEDSNAVTKLAGLWANAVGSLRFDFPAPADTPQPIEFAWWSFLLASWDQWSAGEEFYPYSPFFDEMRLETRRIFPGAGRFSNVMLARTLLEKLYLEEHPGALHVVGMIHRFHGRLGAAERDLRRAAELGLTNAYLDLGLLKTKDYHSAREFFVGWKYDRRTYAWMEAGAEAGNPRAALLVAQELCLLPALKPDYVPVDGARAKRYAELGARAGLHAAEEFVQQLDGMGGPGACGRP